MYRKSLMADHGELSEPSVVEEAHARLFFGQPNSLFGCFYFPLLLIGVLLYVPAESWGTVPAVMVRWLVLIALVTATGTSTFLAFSLAFITKRECLYCWASHLANLLLLIVVPWTLF